VKDLPQNWQHGVIDRLAEQRRTSGARVAALSARLTGIVESSALTTNDDEHDPEGVTVAFERAQVQALLAQAREELDELDLARRRLAEGRYDRCERCGGVIAADRLEALPTARTCITCANRGRGGRSASRGLR
jgi:RNA polymerase-binding transcription factor DksA